MVLMTIVCALVWDGCVAENLYDCTDGFGWDYLQPGNWVHNVGARPVEAVAQIIHHRSMSEPDTIKQGWSVRKLWIVWFLFLGTSLTVSVWLALKRWERKSRQPS